MQLKWMGANNISWKQLFPNFLMKKKKNQNYTLIQSNIPKSPHAGNILRMKGYDNIH